MLVADGVEWLRIYWVRGYLKKGSRFRNEVQDPPCAGWQHAFVLRNDSSNSKKLATIFCPYTMEAYQVSNQSSELATAKDGAEFRASSVQEKLTTNWTKCQTRGWQRDYDICTLIMKKMGWEVPPQIMVGGEEDTRKKGGKDGGNTLIKPVVAKGKRGKFLQWFADNDYSRSVREAMAHFSITRSNALSYLYMLNKDHGIGYELVGDTATINLPEGCTDPFNAEQPKPAVEVVEDDDDWLD